MVRIRRGTVVGIVATVLPLVVAALVAKGFFPARANAWSRCS